MRGIPTVADALDLYARAAYYHRIYLGTDVPDPGYPPFLWERRAGYYADAALMVSIRLQSEAGDTMMRAMLGVENVYGDEARAMTPDEALVHAQGVVEQVRLAQVAFDRLMLQAAIRALGKIVRPQMPHPVTSIEVVVQ